VQKSLMPKGVDHRVISKRPGNTLSCKNL